MGEYTQFVYDEETGMAGKKKTVVAHAPVLRREVDIPFSCIVEQVEVGQVVKLI